MAQSDFLTYKGRPLVRSKDTIYYGSSADKYVIMLQILSKKKVGDEEVADKISVQLLSTDDTLPPAERISKKTEKNGLYNALDIGAIWLERSLKNQ